MVMRNEFNSFKYKCKWWYWKVYVLFKDISGFVLNSLLSPSQYLAFTCGLVRGGLSNLGVKSIVTAEVSVMPACKCLSCFEDRIYQCYVVFSVSCLLYRVVFFRPFLNLCKNRCWMCSCHKTPNPALLIFCFLFFSGKFQVMIQK